MEGIPYVILAIIHAYLNKHYIPSEQEDKTTCLTIYSASC